MYNNDINTKEIFPKMKRLAIILVLIMFAPAAFAGGTVLLMDTPGYENIQRTPLDPYSTYYTQNGVYGGAGQAQGYTSTSRKVRVGGRQKNDPNVYWNFGSVNFGSGFTSVGGGDKKY